MADQLVIKVVLVAVFAALAAILLIPGRGVRHIAIRRLTLFGLFALAILAIIFPASVSVVAQAVGVGRGTDLLLYGLIIVFVGNAIASQRKHRLLEAQITTLARDLAIAQAPPAVEGERSLETPSP